MPQLLRKRLRPARITVNVDVNEVPPRGSLPGPGVEQAYLVPHARCAY